METRFWGSTLGEMQGLAWNMRNLSHSTNLDPNSPINQEAKQTHYYLVTYNMRGHQMAG